METDKSNAGFRGMGRAAPRRPIEGRISQPSHPVLQKTTPLKPPQSNYALVLNHQLFCQPPEIIFVIAALL
jgi:hypothetical protein